MSKYPEIEALNRIYMDHKVEIQFSGIDFLADNKDYRAVEFKIASKVFNCYVEDEQQDIQYDYPLLNLCLVLRELEGYADSPDFLIWSKERYLDPDNVAVLTHFKNLGTIYSKDYW